MLTLCFAAAGPILCPTTEKPHAVTQEKLPICLGHGTSSFPRPAPRYKLNSGTAEFSGTIAAVGEGVEGTWKVGDRVVVCVFPTPLLISARLTIWWITGSQSSRATRSVLLPALSSAVLIFLQCYACSKDYNNACSSLGWIGLSGFGGGLSEYICTDEEYLHALPDNVSRESLLDSVATSLTNKIVQYGAMVEPLAVAMHAVEQSGMKKGDTALVLGAFSSRLSFRRFC